MRILFSFVMHILNPAPASLPQGTVIMDEVEVEAVYIPAGFQGPIVATPGDEPIF